MLNVAVFVSGGGTNLQAILDRQAEGKLGDAAVKVVISSSAAAYALTRAEKAGVPGIVIRPRDYADRAEYSKALLRELAAYETGLIVLAGFMVQVPEAVVEKYENRIINVHPALIPSFCGKGFYGLRVHEAALARGVRVTGATVHFVDPELDMGPIILQKAVEVREGDTPEILQRRVMEEAEWELLPSAVRMIAEGRIAVDGGKVRILAAPEEKAEVKNE